MLGLMAPTAPETGKDCHHVCRLLCFLDPTTYWNSPVSFKPQTPCVRLQNRPFLQPSSRVGNQSSSLAAPASAPGKGTPSTSSAPRTALALRPWPSSPVSARAMSRGPMRAILSDLSARLLVQVEGGGTVSLGCAHGLPRRSQGPGPEGAAGPSTADASPRAHLPPTARFRGKKGRG